MDRLDSVIGQWADEKPHLDTLPMAMIGRLMRLSKHLETHFTECHKAFDLTPGEFDVLATLRRSGGDYCLTPSQLIDSMMLTSGAMTNRLDKLTAKGFISRLHSEADRRSVSVALTTTGFDLIEQAIEKHVEMQHQLVSSLSDKDKRTVDQLLKHWLMQFDSTQ